MSVQTSVKSLFKNKMVSIYALSALLLLVTGCSSHVSNRHGYSYGQHGSVSIGSHGNGAGVLGALIVGGIVGSMINEAENERQKERAERDANRLTSGKRQHNRNDELVNGYSIGESGTASKASKIELVDPQSHEQPAIRGNTGQMQWFQYGKDGRCYQMSVDAGVTDVVAEVGESKCQPSGSR